MQEASEILSRTPWSQIPWLDVCVLAIALGLWFILGIVTSHPRWAKYSIGAAVNAQRLAWMKELVRRPNRNADTHLIGAVMHSVSFFASATVLLLGGAMAMVGSMDRNYVSLRSLSFVPATTREMFELKTIVIALVLIYSFLKFSWSLRQFNYLCVFIGAAPEPSASEEEKETFVQVSSRLLELAATSFNAGLRGYYFVVSVLGWFIHPFAFLVCTGFMIMLVARRQFFSKTHDAMFRKF